MVADHFPDDEVQELFREIGIELRILGELGSTRRKGELRFDRVIIETTGLADPAPIVSTLIAEPVLRHHFRLGNIVATVDAVNGPAPRYAPSGSVDYGQYR